MSEIFATIQSRRLMTSISDALSNLIHGSGGRFVIIAYALIAGASIVPIILSGPRIYPIDFYYFWGAGSVWAEGLSPYGTDYITFLESHKHLHDTDELRPFFYAPNAIALFYPLGLFDHRVAWFLLSGINLLALVWTGFLAAKVSQTLGLTKTLLYPSLLHFAVICLGWGIGKLLFVHAHPTPIYYLGFMLVFSGVLYRRTVPITLGLTLALLKPNLGLPISFACMFIPMARMPAILAGAITGVFAILGAWSGGAIENSLLFLENLQAYSEFPENYPQHLSGASFVVHAISGAHPSAFFWLFVTLAAIGGAAAFRKSGIRSNSYANADLLMISLITSFALLPGHNNYFLPATFAVIWLARKVDPAFCIGFLGAILISQAHRAALALGALSDAHPMLNVALVTTFGIGLLSGAYFVRMAAPRQIGLSCEPADNRRRTPQREIAS